MRRALRACGLAAVAALLGAALLAGYVALRRPYTPAIRDASGRVAPASVAALEKLTLGGLEQWVLLRGRDRAAPLLLFLHGGPGMPAMYLAHRFREPLERSFLVVHWDQRGAGKSYRPGIPAAAIRVENLVADACELAATLGERFGQRRLVLVGHSFGSYVGMLAVAEHPELFRAFVGVGQVVESERTRALQDRFIRERATARGERRLLVEFEARPEELRERLLFRYGGELHGHTSWWPLLASGLLAPEYTLGDVLNVRRGVAFTHAHIDDPLPARPLPARVTAVAVPVYFFAGRHDWCTPGAVAEEYLRQLEAPAKAMVWFERSAHFPFLEEPVEFAAQLERVLREVEAGEG